MCFTGTNVRNSIKKQRNSFLKQRTLAVDLRLRDFLQDTEQKEFMFTVPIEPTLLFGIGYKLK